MQRLVSGRMQVRGVALESEQTVVLTPSARSQPLEFTLVINSKTYRYDTELPSSQQAQFLVTVVRCWRRYMNGWLRLEALPLWIC